MNGAPVSQTSPIVRFLRCGIDTDLYCINMQAVRGIQRLDQLQQHKGQAAGSVGVVQYGTVTLPVYSLAACLGQPVMPPSTLAKVLILQTMRQAWALLVERVEGTLEVAPQAVLPLPKVARNLRAPLFDGVVYDADVMRLVLAPAGLHPHAATDVAVLQAAVAAPEPLPAPGKIPPAPRRTGTLLCFTTEEPAAQSWPLTFGLSLSQVIRMQQTPGLLKVPRAIQAVLGLVDWQGIPLAVLDLSRSLGGRATPLRADDRLLIARAATQRAFVGFLVRPRVHMRSLPIAHQPSQRALPLHDAFVRGRFDLEHETLVIPDIDGLCRPQEELS
jgi:chemotaxis signal transduction protein